MTSPTMYYYTKVLSDLFLDAPYPDTKNTFRGSTQVLDFWRVRACVLGCGRGMSLPYLHVHLIYLVVPV